MDKLQWNLEPWRVLVTFIFTLRTQTNPAFFPQFLTVFVNKDMQQAKLDFCYLGPSVLQDCELDRQTNKILEKHRLIQEEKQRTPILFVHLAKELKQNIDSSWSCLVLKKDISQQNWRKTELCIICVNENLSCTDILSCTHLGCKGSKSTNRRAHWDPPGPRPFFFLQRGGKEKGLKWTGGINLWEEWFRVCWVNISYAGST